MRDCKWIISFMLHFIAFLSLSAIFHLLTSGPLKQCFNVAFSFWKFFFCPLELFNNKRNLVCLSGCFLIYCLGVPHLECLWPEVVDWPIEKGHKKIGRWLQAGSGRCLYTAVTLVSPKRSSRVVLEWKGVGEKCDGGKQSLPNRFLPCTARTTYYHVVFCN